MRNFVIMPILLTLLIGFVSCSTDEPELPPQTEQPSMPEVPNSPNEPNSPNTPDSPNDGNNNADNPMNNQLKITIGSVSFSVTLEANATTKAFKAQLPMTVNMSELNGNEKYYNLSIGLPTASANPGTIRAGDLMLYGSTTLVLFYDTFSTSYSYTRLGRIDNASGLASALGSGSVQVTFELQ